MTFVAHATLWSSNVMSSQSHAAGVTESNQTFVWVAESPEGLEVRDSGRSPRRERDTSFACVLATARCSVRLADFQPRQRPAPPSPSFFLRKKGSPLRVTLALLVPSLCSYSLCSFPPFGRSHFVCSLALLVPSLRSYSLRSSLPSVGHTSCVVSLRSYPHFVRTHSVRNSRCARTLPLRVSVTAAERQATSAALQ